MTNEETLVVLLQGRRVATLTRAADARLSLQYIEDPDTLPMLSVSLPPRTEPYPHDAALPFFDGLLPEGTIRDRLATRLRTDPSDVFGLLREVGRDCAGAVQLVPESEGTANAQDDVRWLTEGELAVLLDELAERPFADDPSRGIRISLAGAQDKLVVVVRDGRFGLPVGSTASTHILKPPSTQRRGRHGDRLAYPDLVANEAFCMTLASLIGLTVAHASVVHIQGEPILLVERYDRESQRGQLLRVHQEDFCQALSLPSRLKYEQDGGPGVSQFLGLIDRWSVDVANDRDEFIARIALNFLVGNADAHAKNHSLLHATTGIRLAPAYDILSTAVYAQLAKEMATSITGIFDPDRLGPDHFTRWLSDLGLSRTHFAPLIAGVAERAIKAVEVARERTRDEFGAEVGLLGTIAEHVTQRAGVLSRLG